MSDPTPTFFALPAELTAPAAEALAQALAPLAPAAGMRLLLDASRVEAVSACGAQVLVSLHKAAGAAGGNITLSNAGEPVLRALRDMGLSWLAGPERAA